MTNKYDFTDILKNIDAAQEWHYQRRMAEATRLLKKNRGYWQKWSCINDCRYNEENGMYYYMILLDRTTGDCKEFPYTKQMLGNILHLCNNSVAEHTREELCRLLPDRTNYQVFMLICRPMFFRPEDDFETEN